MAIHANSTTTPAVPGPALPAVAIAAAAYRALTIYGAPPTGCFAHILTHDRFAPHLAIGEQAVVDPDDREPVSGEMFVVRIETPRFECGYVHKLVQLRQRRYDGPAGAFDGWMLHFSLIRHYGRRLSVDEVLAKLRTGEMSVCDGPVTREGIRTKIVGRVVGVVLEDLA